MLLNMAIIVDSLNGDKILQKSVDKMKKRHLRLLRMYQRGCAFQEDVLYIALAEELPPQPVFEGELSLICLGYPPIGYVTNEHIEFICLSVSEDSNRLFREVLEIFYYWDEIDTRIKDMLINDVPLPNFADIAFEIFGTPVTVYGSHEKIMLQVYDKNRPENREYYMNNTTEEYLPDEEKSVLYTDKEFLRTFDVHGPGYSRMEGYNTDIVFYNLFVNSYYIGRLIIENTYRPLKDGDYGLAEWFGEYMKILLKLTKQFRFPVPQAFEVMMQNLAMENGYYRSEYDEVLTAAGWDVSDHYICVAITMPKTPESSRILNESAFYLTEILSGHYIFLQPDYILAAVDMDRCELLYNEVLRRLKIFLKNNGLTAGISTAFSDFSGFPIFLRQAKMVAEYALADGRKKLYEFDACALDIMLSSFRRPGGIYCANALQKLYAYDRDNNADLVKTLKCYLDNSLNISKTNEQLYIARTTCLYRIKRIQKITHFDLEDPEMNLYLRLVLRLMSERGV